MLVASYSEWGANNLIGKSADNQVYCTFKANSTARLEIMLTVYANKEVPNLIFKPMIYKGDYDETKVFEQYVGGQPSPNPDYPQDIKVVTGKNVIKLKGPNLIDESKLTFLQSDNIQSFDNNLAITKNLNISGNNNIGLRVPTAIQPAIEEGEYFISVDVRLKEGNCERINSIQILTEKDMSVSATWIEQPAISNEFKRYIRKYTVTSSDENNSIRAVLVQAYNCANAVLEITNIQVSKSNVDYEPYVDPREKELNLKSKNIAYSYNYRNQTNQYSGLVDTSYELKAGKTYTISFDTDNSGLQVYRQDSEITGMINPNRYNFLCDGTRKSYIATAKNDGTYTVKGFISRLTPRDDTSCSISNFMISESTDITYEPYYNYELYKNGYISKESDGYYLNNKFKKFFLDSTKKWIAENPQKDIYRYYCQTLDDLGYKTATNIFGSYSNYFKSNTEDIGNNYSTINNLFYLRYINNTNRIDITTKDYTTLEDFIKFLNDKSVEILYPLDTLLKIKITEQPLIDQLNAIYNSRGNNGTTIIETESEEENAPLIVQASALKSWEVEESE